MCRRIVLSCAVGVGYGSAVSRRLLLCGRIGRVVVAAVVFAGPVLGDELESVHSMSCGNVRQYLRADDAVMLRYEMSLHLMVVFFRPVRVIGRVQLLVHLRLLLIQLCSEWECCWGVGQMCAQRDTFVPPALHQRLPIHASLDTTALVDLFQEPQLCVRRDTVVLLERRLAHHTRALRVTCVPRALRQQAQAFVVQDSTACRLPVRVRCARRECSVTRQG